MSSTKLPASTSSTCWLKARSPWRLHARRRQANSRPQEAAERGRDHLAPGVLARGRVAPKATSLTGRCGCINGSIMFLSICDMWLTFSKIMTRCRATLFWRLSICQANLRPAHFSLIAEDQTSPLDGRGLSHQHEIEGVLFSLWHAYESLQAELAIILDPK